MGKFIGIRAGAVVEKDGQVEGLGGFVQVEKIDEEQRLLEVDGKEIFSNRSKQANPKAVPCRVAGVAVGGRDLNWERTSLAEGRPGV